HRFPDLADTLAVAGTGGEAALRDALRLVGRLPSGKKRRVLGLYGGPAGSTLVKDGGGVGIVGPVGRARWGGLWRVSGAARIQPRTLSGTRSGRAAHCILLGRTGNTARSARTTCYTT